MITEAEKKIAGEDRVLRALERETDVLLDRVLQVFLEIDFQEHSVLGGFTPGHVVTYLAREGDRMADELLAAACRPVPPPDRGRQWELDQGSLRPGAVLIDDVHVSAERLRDAIAGIEDWSTLDDSARSIPARRLLQLIVHHADLGRPWGTVPDDDAEIAAAKLPSVLWEELAGISLDTRAELAGLHASKLGSGVMLVSGPAPSLLAWATGRGERDASEDLPQPGPRIWI